MVRSPILESAGPDSNPGQDCLCTGHPAVHLSSRAGRQVGTWVNLGKVNHSNPDVVFVLCGLTRHKLKSTRQNEDARHAQPRRVPRLYLLLLPFSFYCVTFFTPVVIHFEHPSSYFHLQRTTENSLTFLSSIISSSPLADLF